MDGVIDLHTGCKINLFLRVGQRLENGYHELETAFVLLDEPRDCLTLSFENAPRPAISLACEIPGIHPENNTLVRAHTAYMAVNPLPLTISARLGKGVPLGAGLGGGSANAAGLLQVFEHLAAKLGLPTLGRERLAELAAGVGADVPVFLEKDALGQGAGELRKRQTPPVYYATGIGERLVPVENPFSGQYLALVCPKEHVSTAWAFSALDNARRNQGFPNEKERAWASFTDRTGPATEEPGKNSAEMKWNLTSRVQRAISFASWETSGKTTQKTGLINDFEQVVFPKYPLLAALRDDLLDAGATTALLSGTGASVFGVFAEFSAASAFVKTVRHRAFVCAL